MKMRINAVRNSRGFFNFSLNMWIVVVNLIAFSVFLFFPGEFIAKFIAIDPYYIWRGKYLWTFITSMFMHTGFFHLFVNMLSLIFVGSLVEKLIGRKRYLWFYLISGIFAGVLFVLSYFIAGNLDLHVPAVGASGALFGLIGILVLLTPNLPVYIMFIPIPIKMKYAAPGILVLLWIISIAGDVPIGNMAHLGGLVAGLVYGLYLRRKYKRKTSIIRKYFV